MVSNRYPVTTLGELFDLNTRTVSPSDDPKGYFEYYSIPAYDESKVPTVELGSSIRSNKYVLTDMALLVSKLNPRINRVWKFVPKDGQGRAVCSTEFIVYTATLPDVDYDYFYHLFTSDLFRDTLLNLQSGTTGSRMRVTPSDTLNIEVPRPPLPEQRKIAAILTSVNDAITATQRIIDATERVKRGLMQQLLTRGIGHTAFKQTEIGEIPAEWDVVTLESVVRELRAGVSVNSENRPKVGGEFGILKTSAVTYGVFRSTEHKAILADEVSRATETPLRDHIIVSRMNTPALVGASAYVDRDFPDLFLPDRLWQVYIHSPEAVSCKWLSYILGWNTMRTRIGEIATGTSGSMKNISKSAFLAIKLAVPTVIEQKKIANVLSSVDDRIEVERGNLVKLRALKSSLMQVLLTGKVRVNVDSSREVSV